LANAHYLPEFKHWMQTRYGQFGPASFRYLDEKYGPEFIRDTFAEPEGRTRKGTQALICLICGSELDLDEQPFQCATGSLEPEQCLLFQQAALLSTMKPKANDNGSLWRTLENPVKLRRG
jgi:hypothetical protein